MRPIASAMVCALCLTARTAWCEQRGETAESASETALDVHRFAVLGHVGLYTPLGFGGASLEYSIAPWLVAGAGAGTNTRSLEMAAGTQFRLSLGGGLSTGAGLGLAYGQPYSPCLNPFGTPSCELPSSVPSADVSVYLESRPARDFISRLYTGLLDPLRTGEHSVDPAARAAPIVPYVGVAFGTVL
jgi:hypothetical protein